MEHRSKYCCIRILQFIACIVCLSISIYILNQLHPVISYTLICVSVAFLFLTFLDLWGLWIARPIPYTSWSMVCAAATLFFSFCCGLLIARSDGSTCPNIFPVIFGLTALLFLFELLRELCSPSERRQTAVMKYVDPIYEQKVTQTRGSTPSVEKLQPVEEEIIVPHRLPEPIGLGYSPKSEERAIQHSNSAEMRTLQSVKSISKEKVYPISSYRRTESKEKATQLQVTSHGGTFHMSKDTAPMPSPPSAGTSKGTENTIDDSRTVSVSTRLVYKNCKGKCNTVHNTPRKSPPEIKRVVKSALPYENTLEYDVSSTGSQIPQFYTQNSTKTKDKRCGTAPVMTNDAYTSMSSFVQQKSEKIQVHSRPKPTKEVETHTMEELELHARDSSPASAHSPGHVPTTTTSLQYGRCGRCMGYYLLPPGYNYYSQTCPSPSHLDSTPRECCPCPPSLRQGNILTAAEVEIISTESCPESNDEANCTPISAGSVNSEMIYNTTIMDDENDGSNRRNKRRKYKWMPIRRRNKSDCSVQ